MWRKYSEFDVDRLERFVALSTPAPAIEARIPARSELVVAARPL